MLSLARGRAEDIPFILTTERREGYETLVGRWDGDRHAALLDDPAYAYFIARRADEPVGFAILRDWRSPDEVCLLKRIAVTSPGRGVGRALLEGVIERLFRDTETWRLWLGVFPDNQRARRCYEAVGFRAEGVARGSAYFGGEHRDELIMALLRPDWDARRG